MSRNDSMADGGGQTAVNCTHQTPGNASDHAPLCEDGDIRRMKEIITLTTTCVNMVISLGIVIGNSLVLAAYVKYKFVRTVHNSLLLQMSMADLLTAPAIVSANVLTNFFIDSEIIGELCITTSWLFTLCFQGQIWMLLLVTINRWVSIRYPLRHHIMFTRRKAVVLSSVVWTLLFSMDTGCMYHHVWMPGVKCYPFRVMNRLCFKVLVYPLILVPLLAMPIMYAVLMRFAFLHNKAMKAHVQSSSDNKLQSRSREVKTLKTLGLILGILYISWLPTFVLSVVMKIEPRSFPAAVAQKLFRDIATSCLYLGSLFNPLVYHRSSATFRKAFLLLLSRPNEGASGSSQQGQRGYHLASLPPQAEGSSEGSKSDSRKDASSESDASKITQLTNCNGTQ